MEVSVYKLKKAMMSGKSRVEEIPRMCTQTNYSILDPIWLMSAYSSACGIFCDDT